MPFHLSDQANRLIDTDTSKIVFNHYCNFLRGHVYLITLSVSQTYHVQGRLTKKKKKKSFGSFQNGRRYTVFQL